MLTSTFRYDTGEVENRLYKRSTEHDEGQGVQECRGCVATADQNSASEREQNAKCAARGLHSKIRNLIKA
jgi:hypothetical protein